MRSPFEVTILFIPVSAPSDKLATDWAEDCDEIILRRCPVCERDSIVGHGRRRKQAHDEHHDWIGSIAAAAQIAGRPSLSFPLFSLPYTHYSLVARSQALQRRFAEHCSWEKALPKLKDPDRVARSLHRPPLVNRCGFSSTGSFLSQPDRRPRGSLAGSRPSGS